MATPSENHDLEGCFACGSDNPGGMHLRFKTLAPGEVEAACRLDPAWTSWRGLAHGGLLATMMDESLGWAVSTLGRTALTARLEVRYLVAVQPGAELVVAAKVLRHDRRLAEVEAEVRLPGGRKVATARAMMFYADTLPVPAES